MNLRFAIDSGIFAVIFFLVGAIFGVTGRKKDVKETHTEETLFTVFRELKSSGLSDNEAQDTILRMQNEGILFREVVK